MGHRDIVWCEWCGRLRERRKSEWAMPREVWIMHTGNEKWRLTREATKE